MKRNVNVLLKSNEMYKYPKESLFYYRRNDLLPIMRAMYDILPFFPFIYEKIT